jgi:adenylyltransferase/sulfurtransferase
MFGVSYHSYGSARVTGMRPPTTRRRFGQCAKFGKLTMPIRPTRAVSRSIFSVAWKMRFRELKLRKDPDCPVCGERATIKELIDYEEFCGLRPAQSQAEEKPQMEEITATELKQRLDRGDDIQIIDVREQNEYDIARMPGAKLIPLAQVVERRGEIEESRETVVHCKGGVRSARAIEALQRAGFRGHLVNLKGGITAWSNDVDPSVPKY